MSTWNALKAFSEVEGFEFYEYDQLGSYYSDQPKDTQTWTNRPVCGRSGAGTKTIGADQR